MRRFLQGGQAEELEENSTSGVRKNSRGVLAGASLWRVYAASTLAVSRVRAAT
jgi:hypothetical protein